MALATSRINKAKILLEVPVDKINERKDEASRLIAAMNYYYLSPVFLCMGGLGLKQQLEKKYSIKHRLTFCDFITNFITVPFTDELFIFSAFIIGATLMCLWWKPAWEKSAYDRGFNYVHNVNHDPWNNIWQPALHGAHNSACVLCNQDIFCSVSNSTVSCQNEFENYCFTLSLADEYAAISKAALQGIGVYLDPNSFVNNTYVIYFLTDGNINNGDWAPIFCNRTTEANYQRDQAKIYWHVSYWGVLVGGVVFYVVFNYLLKCIHAVGDDIDPANYRLVRRDIESAKPAKPITKADYVSIN